MIINHLGLKGFDLCLNVIDLIHIRRGLDNFRTQMPSLLAFICSKILFMAVFFASSRSYLSIAFSWSFRSDQGSWPSYDLLYHDAQPPS